MRSLAHRDSHGSATRVPRGCSGSTAPRRLRSRVDAHGDRQPVEGGRVTRRARCATGHTNLRFSEIHPPRPLPFPFFFFFGNITTPLALLRARRLARRFVFVRASSALRVHSLDLLSRRKVSSTNGCCVVHAVRRERFCPPQSPGGVSIHDDRNLFRLSLIHI